MNPRSITTPLLVTAMFAATATSAHAAATPVTGGTALWSQANVYEPLPVRTFLGHTTRPGSPMMGQSNGTVTASNGANVTAPDGTVGAVVGPESARGASAVFGFGFPVASGSVDAAAGAIDIESTGTIGYAQYPGLGAGAPPVLTVNNPRIVIKNGLGAVYASGAATAGPPSYDRTTPLFTINAAAATFTTDAAAGTVTVSGLVPTIGTAGIFGTAGQYPVGVAGPDRTPNTFGTFSVKVNLLADYPAKTVVPITAPAPVTPAAPAAGLTPTAPAALLSTNTLTKSAFDAKRAIVVKVRPRGSFASLGEGTVKGKVLTIKTPGGVKLSGKYVLSRVAKSTKLPKSVVVTVASKS